MWSSLLLVPIGASLTCQTPLLEHKRQSLAINIPSTVPNEASDIVDHGYPALAMSAHSFQDYAGNASSPNIFSANLIQSIANRTGAPVHIRVGGTSGDFSVFEADQEAALVLPPDAAPGAIPKGMEIGTSWFEGFSNFPGVKWTYMAHLANNSDGMQANSVAAVQEALQYIGSDLENLEIGNEIDLYPNVNRAATYNAAAYLEEWNAYEAAITSAVGNKTYQAPVYANNRCPFCIANTFGRGQNSLGNVKTASLHHYMDGGPVPPTSVQSNYMNHTKIVNELEPFTTPVAWLRANKPDVPLYLGEVNSNTFSSDNYDVIGIFGSTLWLADYLLHGMTLNIRRVNVQQSTDFSYTSWRGVESNGLPPAVLPPYYAHPFVADVIGNQGDVRVASLSSTIASDTFSGYAIYNASTGALAKAVLINLNLYNSTTGGARPAQAVTLDLGAVSSSYSTFVTVEKLTAPGAEIQDSSKISWKGESWTYGSGGKPFSTASTTESVPVTGGKASVIIQASEAVLVTF